MNAAIDLNTASKPYIIFEIDIVPGVPADAQHAWFQDWAKRRNYGFKELRGAWKGVESISYIMSADLEPQISRTWAKGQEAILYLTAKAGHYRQARLHWSDGRREGIGEWKPIPAELARRHGDYTYDPSTQYYYRAM